MKIRKRDWETEKDTNRKREENIKEKRDTFTQTGTHRHSRQFFFSFFCGLPSSVSINTHQNDNSEKA